MTLKEFTTKLKLSEKMLETGLAGTLYMSWKKSGLSIDKWLNKQPTDYLYGPAGDKTRKCDCGDTCNCGKDCNCDENCPCNKKQAHWEMEGEKAVFKKEEKGMKITIIRHGATKYNSGEGAAGSEKIRGWLNVPLDEHGVQEAKDLGQKLKDSGIEVIIASDLQRAKDTAQYVGKAIGVPVKELTKAFRPWNLGLYNGKEVKDVLPLLDKYARKTPDEPVDGGESFNEFRMRFFNKLKEVYKKYGDKHVAIVAHHRNERLLDAWKDKGQPSDFSVDMDDFLNKGIEPGTSEEMIIKPMKEDGK